MKYCNEEKVDMILICGEYGQNAWYLACLIHRIIDIF